MLRNIGSNWVLLAVNIGAMYILTPFVIHTLGNEAYGTWTLITALSGYIGLLALGVPMASVRYLTEQVTAGNARQLNVVIGSCAGLYVMAGAAAVLVTLAFVGTLGSFRIPDGIEAQAYIAFGVMAIYLAASYIGLLPEGIMFAHHDFVLRNVVRISAMVLRFGLTWTLLQWRASIVVLAFVQVACLIFDVSMSYALIRRRYPEVRISLGDFDRREARRILSFSAYVLLLAAGARLTFETDALVIGRMLGVGQIPYYVVANSLIVYLMDFIIAIAAVVSPMATKLYTERRMDALRDMFLKWSKVALSLTMLGGVFLVIMGPRFIGWWIEPSFERPAGQVLQILMLSTVVFLPVRGVAMPILVGIGKPQAPAIGFVISGLLNLVLSVGLAHVWGLTGVAVGTAIPSVLFAILLLRIACRELEIGVWAWGRYVIPRAAAGALPSLALLLWCRFVLGVDTLFGIAVAGAAAVLLYSATSVLFVYHRDPLLNLAPHFVRIRAWSRI